MSKIKIGIKMRQHSEHEKNPKKEVQWIITDDNSLQCVDSLHPSIYKFDHIFGPKSLNHEVYSTIVDPVVKSSMLGCSGTILIYGQAASGKNFTSMGNDKDPGIHVLTIEQLFRRTDISPDLKFQIRVGYAEIFKEKLFDLLDDRNPVKVDAHGAFTAKEFTVKTSKEAIEILFSANKKRKPSQHDKHKLSSRSNTIFRIMIESQDDSNGTIKASCLTIVYVAGSEIVSESRLSEQEKGFMFGGSSLMLFLQNSFAGTGSAAAVICHIRWQGNVKETISTLEFANRVKNWQNTPVIKIPDEMSDSKIDTKRKLDVEKVPEKPFKRVKTISELSSSSSTIQSSSTTTVPVNYFSASESSEMFSLQHQFEEITNVKVENLLLMQQFEDVAATHEKGKKWFAEQMKAAKLDLQKLQFRHSHEKIILTKMQSELQQRLDNSIATNQDLLAKLEAAHKSNQNSTDVLVRQTEALNYLKAENLQLKRKNNRLRDENNSFAGKIGIGMNKKIKRLEDNMSKSIQMLKNELEIESITGRNENVNSGDKDVSVSHKMSVPDNLVGCIIGPGRTIMKRILHNSGARVHISERDGSYNRNITITGSNDSVTVALDMIQEKIIREKLRLKGKDKKRR